MEFSTTKITKEGGGGIYGYCFDFIFTKAISPIPLGWKTGLRGFYYNVRVIRNFTHTYRKTHNPIYQGVSNANKGYIVFSRCFVVMSSSVTTSV